MNKIIESLIQLLDNPDNQKVYLDIRDYYKSLKLNTEANGIDKLISRKFSNANSSLPDEKQ